MQETLPLLQICATKLSSKVSNVMYILIWTDYKSLQKLLHITKIIFKCGLHFIVYSFMQEHDWSCRCYFLSFILRWLKVLSIGLRIRQCSHLVCQSVSLNVSVTDWKRPRLRINQFWFLSRQLLLKLWVVLCEYFVMIHLHLLIVNGLFFQPASDRYLLGTGGNDSLVKLWEIIIVDELTAAASQLFQLVGHGGDITCVRFPLNSAHIVASTATDKTARIWDTVIEELSSRSGWVWVQFFNWVN